MLSSQCKSFGPVTNHTDNIITPYMGYFRGKSLFSLDVCGGDPCSCYQPENKCCHEEVDYSRTLWHELYEKDELLNKVRKCVRALNVVCMYGKLFHYLTLTANRLMITTWEPLKNKISSTMMPPRLSLRGIRTRSLSCSMSYRNAKEYVSPMLH